MNERLIFLTNDDGFDSRGMEALIDIARRFGRVVVVAPERPQSGMSHAFTMLSPLFIRKVREEEGLEVYALSGTPVDCVKVAFDYLLRERKVDLVLSGINHGSNSAVALLYSGTMGAAIEGSFYDCPSIGLSLTDHRPDADFTAARIWGERIVRDVLEHPAPLPLCLNVNIPAGDDPRHPRLPAGAGVVARTVRLPTGPARARLPVAHGRVRQRRARSGGNRRMGAHARLRLGTARTGRPDGLPAHGGNAAALRPIAGERRTVPRRRTAHEGGNTPVEYNV